MKITNFIDEDPKTSVLGKYRIVDQDICVAVVDTKNRYEPELIDFNVNQILTEMEVDSYYSVFDISNILWAEKEAKDWIKGPLAARVVKGYAIIAETPFSWMLSQLWVRLTTLPFPVQSFKSFEEGMAWITALKKEHLQQELTKRA